MDNGGKKTQNVFIIKDGLSEGWARASRAVSGTRSYNVTEYGSQGLGMISPEQLEKKIRTICLPGLLTAGRSLLTLPSSSFFIWEKGQCADP